jgi:hypothetical protein
MLISCYDFCTRTPKKYLVRGVELTQDHHRNNNGNWYKTNPDVCKNANKSQIKQCQDCKADNYLAISPLSLFFYARVIEDIGRIVVVFDKTPSLTWLIDNVNRGLIV